MREDRKKTEPQNPYEAWLEYYDDMEELDRRYPHGPARNGNAVVVVYFSSRVSKEFVKKKKEEEGVIKRRLNIRLNRFGFMPGEAQREKMDAVHAHEQRLKPCTCPTCEEARWPR